MILFSRCEFVGVNSSERGMRRVGKVIEDGVLFRGGDHAVTGMEGEQIQSERLDLPEHLVAFRVALRFLLFRGWIDG